MPILAKNGTFLVKVFDEDIDDNGIYVIPNSVIEIKPFAFKNLSKLKEVVFHSNIRNINTGAFQNCVNLKFLELPNSIVNIGNCAFYNCRSLEYVILPSNLTVLKNYVFRNCVNLKTILIPNTVTLFWDGCFRNCISLEYFSIPPNITLIGNYCFYRCTSIPNTLHFPKSLGYIGKHCFQYSSVKEPIFSSRTMLDKYAFNQNVKYNLPAPYNVVALQRKNKI